jgi:peroxiredoxin (alkyl hydroperoxide reductase subunit C)
MVNIGQPAPLFSADALMPDGNFGRISLEDFKGRWVTLFFYPLDFTFVCPTEILQLHQLHSKFDAEGCAVLGCSVDSVHSHRRWVKDDLGGELSFPLLGDTTHALAKDYGVLIPDKGVATRGTFIIDPEGRIQYACLHNQQVGRDVQEILRVLQALKSGELCGAGWRPGQDFVNPA